jgi:heavy metal efflux system protein
MHLLKKPEIQKKIIMTKAILILLFLCVVTPMATGQALPGRLTLENALDLAIKNNAGIQASRYDVEASKALKKTYGEIGKTNVTGMFGQYNSSVRSDNNVTITQSIPFPTVFTAGAALGKATVARSEMRLRAVENELVFNVKSVYYHLIYLKALRSSMLRQDSLYANFERAAVIRYRTGETSLIEKTTAETQARNSNALLLQNAADIRIDQIRLQTLLNESMPVDSSIDSLDVLPLPVYDTSSYSGNPLLNFYKQQATVAEKQKTLATNHLLPDITLGYFNQTLIGTPLQLNSTELATSSKRFDGFIAGISIPLWIGPQVAKVQAAHANRQMAESDFEQQRKTLRGQWNETIQDIQKYRDMISYYQTSSLPNAGLLTVQSQRAYQQGEIGYLEYLQSLRTAAEIRTAYINAINNYNQSTILLEYLIGKNKTN